MSETPLSDFDASSILDELMGSSPDAAFLEQVAAQQEQQEQVDASGAPASSGIVTMDEVQLFPLGQDQFRPGERLMGLERIGEKLTKGFKDVIEPLARARATLAVPSVETCTFGEWRGKLPDFTSISHYRLRPLRGGMLIAIDPDFITGLVESFYGGSGGGVRPKRKGFTASEDLLVQRLVDKLVGATLAQWGDVLPMEASLVERDVTALHIGFARNEEPVAVQCFPVAAGVHRTTITLVYPVAMLRPIEAQLAAKVHDDSANGDDDWRWRLAHAMEDVSLPVRSVLARPEISVAGLLALKPGDVIPITLAPRTPLLAGARHIAEGVIGEQDGRAALMIERVGDA